MAPKQPTSTIETISPETARQYLQLNERNRPVSAHRVATYAMIMKNRQWILTGEPLIFNDGRLLNGQHRLLACVQANETFDTFVVRDVPEAAFTVMDSGLNRKLSDVLAMDGFNNAKDVAAMANLVIGYCTGKTTFAFVTVQRQNIIEHVRKNALTYETAVQVGHAARNAGFTRSVFGALAVFVHDHQRFDEFIHGVLNGVNLQHGDSRLTLRNWFMARHGRQASVVKFCATIKSWNAFVEDKSHTKMYAFTNGVIPRGTGFKIPDDLKALEDSNDNATNS